ncbi:MAG TPA: hypothetical protein VGQ44_17145 [Gemmatimonadaceae bacterium]|jgi:hypothetical protein|nr:hypothetical protein [Gemmatimonadaceae bacterium]
MSRAATQPGRASLIEWREASLPPDVKQLVAGRTRLYVSTRTLCKVLVSHEPATGWHLSISHPWRDPSWDEIKSARYTLLGDELRMTMDLPPSSEFVDVHEYCFHLYECRCKHKSQHLRNRPMMRAKMSVREVTKPYEGAEQLHMAPVVSGETFGPNGESENNSYSRWTPSGSLSLVITNPNLHGKFTVGDEYYVDFTPAPKA